MLTFEMHYISDSEVASFPCERTTDNIMLCGLYDFLISVSLLVLKH